MAKAPRGKGVAGKPLGSGANFEKVENEAKASGARNPQAVAAMAGMHKYGKAGMAALAAKGRKK